jgi:sec-independent protein translocase protein TatA
MGSFSMMHWLVVLLVVLLLFGAGKIPRLMGDLAKGIKTFKTNMNENDEATNLPTKTSADDQKAA